MFIKRPVCRAPIASNANVNVAQTYCHMTRHYPLSCWSLAHLLLYVLVNVVHVWKLAKDERMTGRLLPMETVARLKWRKVIVYSWCKFVTVRNKENTIFFSFFFLVKIRERYYCKYSALKIKPGIKIYESN